jgi:hypothetical protein
MSELQPAGSDALDAGRASTPRTYTLADVNPGDTVVVRNVSPAMRDVLADFGVREGERLLCESTQEHMIVRTADGRVPLARSVMSSVTVSPVTVSPVADGPAPAA